MPFLHVVIVKMFAHCIALFVVLYTLIYVNKDGDYKCDISEMSCMA